MDRNWRQIRFWKQHSRIIAGATIGEEKYDELRRKDFDDILLSSAFCGSIQTALVARGIPAEQIRHYGFAFEGKNVLIGA